MTYLATVFRVMIASPTDVHDARDAVERAIHGWNDANAKNKAIILQPWRWETSSVPVLGGHPQKLINAQGVDDSDIVFALFGTRVGSPTPDAISGTAEEVDRALGEGKPVHLYFSDEPLPNDIDTGELDSLRDFKSEMQKRGLLGKFSNVEQLAHEVWKAIEHDIAELKLDPTAASSSAHTRATVEFEAQPQQEQQASGTDSKGAPRYKTRHWVDVKNIGDQDAEGVVFESVGEESGFYVATTGRPTTIHAGQTRRVPVEYLFGSGERILRIRWSEDGQEKQREFHVG